jgi:hypothetical protein
VDFAITARLAKEAMAESHLLAITVILLSNVLVAIRQLLDASPVWQTLILEYKNNVNNVLEEHTRPLTIH